MMIENGWIKLHRKLLEWEWYDDINTTRLFVHLLLTVNIEDDSWHGVHVPRGSRIASVATLAKETKLSERQIRTALNHMISTNEVTKSSTAKYTLFSVVNYDSYQSDRQGERQTTDKIPTSKATNNRQAKRQSADRQSDKPNDKLSDSQESPKSEVSHDSYQSDRQGERQATDGQMTNCRQESDNQSDNRIRREEDKKIDVVADAHAREVNERENFCRKIEKVFGELTGKLASGSDARKIFALYDQCTDADLIVESMRTAAQKFTPKYIGDKIQSFSYFVPVINSAISDARRHSHGETGRSDGQAAVGSSAFTGEVRNGTPSGFSSD